MRKYFTLLCAGLTLASVLGATASVQAQQRIQTTADEVVSQSRLVSSQPLMAQQQATTFSRYTFTKDGRLHPFKHLNNGVRLTAQSTEGDDDLSDLDVEVSDEQESDEFSWGRFLEETLSTEAGGSYISTDGGYRRSMYGQVGFKWSIDWFSLALLGRSSNTALKYERKLRSDFQGDPSAPAKKQRVTFTYKYSTDEISEGYLQFKLGSFMVLSAGRQRVVWGQFLIFSPVDYMSMPVRSDASGGSFGKLESRLPQDVAALYTFFTPQIELQLYHFPKITFDPLNKRIIDQGSIYVKPALESGNYVYKEVEVKTKLPSKKEETQQAARLMFYFDFATFGFTYYDGWNTQSAVERDKLKTETISGNQYHYSEKNPQLQKTKLKGFEFASRTGAWTWKVEMASTEGAAEYEMGIRKANSTAPGFYISSTPDMNAFIDWVKNKNKSRLYSPITTNFWAVGVDAEPGRWLLSFVLFHLQEKKDALAEQGARLYKNARPEQSESDLNTAPAIHVSRYVGAGQDSQWGVLAGIVGVGSGASVYFKQRWNEHFLWGINAESIEYFANEDLDDLDGDGNYERTKTETTGIRLLTKINL